MVDNRHVPVEPGKLPKFQLLAGDTGNLQGKILALQTRVKKQLNKSYPIISIHEAGLGGFWVHRFLQNEGVESHVVDADNCHLTPPSSHQN